MWDYAIYSYYTDRVERLDTNIVIKCDSIDFLAPFNIKRGGINRRKCLAGWQCECLYIPK